MHICYIFSYCVSILALVITIGKQFLRCSSHFYRYYYYYYYYNFLSLRIFCVHDGIGESEKKNSKIHHTCVRLCFRSKEYILVVTKVSVSVVFGVGDGGWGV